MTYDVGAFPVIAAVVVAPTTARRLRKAGFVCWVGGWLAGLYVYFGISR